MKNFRKILLALLVCNAFQHLKALVPVATYTFVDPCYAFTSVSAVPGTKNCFSFSVTNAQPGDLNSYYTWHFGDGQSAQGKSLYHCYSVNATASQYTVSLAYVSPACPTGPLYEVYTVTLSPQTATNCTSDPTVTVVAPSVTVSPYQGSLIPEILSVYDYGDGQGFTQALTHTYAACGSYIITYKNYDMNAPANACYSYTSVNIPCTEVPTGTKKISVPEQVRVFPNPAKHSLGISTPAALKSGSIFDLTGRETKAELTILSTAMAEIEVRSLAPGVYFLQLQFLSGAQQVIKFIKE